MKNQYTYTAKRSQGASKWWVVPLIILLLLLGLIGAYALMNNADEEQAATQDSRSSQSSEADTNTQPADNSSITELSALLALNADTVSDGQEVNVQSAPVVEVLNDRAFTVGQDGKVQFALLSAPLDDGQAESAVQVEAGQTVTLQGKVTMVPDDTMQLQNDYGLTEAHAQQLASQGFYVLVESIQQQ